MSRYASKEKIDFTPEFRNDLIDNVNWPENSPKWGKWHVEYGFDYVLGYFLQLWPADEISEGIIKNVQCECFDYDSLTKNFTGSKLAHFLKLIAQEQDDEMLLKHAENAFLDIPF